MAHGRAHEHIQAHTSTNRAFRLTFDGLLVLGLSFLCDGFLVLSKKPCEQAATPCIASLQPARVSRAERRSNNADAKATGTWRVGLNEAARQGHREEQHCPLHCHCLFGGMLFFSRDAFFSRAPFFFFSQAQRIFRFTPLALAFCFFPFSNTPSFQGCTPCCCWK